MQNTEIQLHYIIGIGRSGTTILSKLLNRYKAIHAIPELNFFLFFFHQYKSKKHFTKKDIDLLFEQIELYTKSHYTPIWEINIEEAKKIVITAIEKNEELNYISICKLIYQQVKVVGVDKTNADILLHKSPLTTLFADKIIEHFPQSKFIWLVRDYRASTLSLKQSIQFKSPHIAYNATRWNIYNSDALKLKNKYPNNLLLIKYEDLVTNSEKTFELIEHFLKIKKEYEVINFENTQLENIKKLPISDKLKDRYLKKHSDLSKPLNNVRASAWKQELNKNEIVLAETICYKIGNKLNYTTMFPANKLSLIKNIFHQIKAYWDIYKERILYYIPITIKIKRLKKQFD